VGHEALEGDKWGGFFVWGVGGGGGGGNCVTPGVRWTSLRYGVAMTSRLLKIIGLFCKRAL